MAPAVVLCSLNQPLDLALGQMLARPIRGVGFAHRQDNCAFFGGWTDHFEVVNCRHFPLPDWMTAHISPLLPPVDQEKLPAPMSHFDSPAEAHTWKKQKRNGPAIGKTAYRPTPAPPSPVLKTQKRDLC